MFHLVTMTELQNKQSLTRLISYNLFSKPSQINGYCGFLLILASNCNKPVFDLTWKQHFNSFKEIKNDLAFRTFFIKKMLLKYDTLLRSKPSSRNTLSISSKVLRSGSLSICKQQQQQQQQQIQKRSFLAFSSNYTSVHGY